jgi:hypothetical protein
MNSRSFFTHFVLTIGLLISGCTKVARTQAPSLLPTSSFIASQLPVRRTPSRTPLPSFTPSHIQLNIPTSMTTETLFQTGVNYINITSVPEGDYLVYFDNPLVSSLPNNIYLSIANSDGEYIGVITQVNRSNNVSISPNLQYVAEPPEILDIVNKVTISNKKLQDCWEPPSWAPDSQQFIASCIRDGNPNLFLFSLTDQTLVPITNFDERFSGRMPSWSPDGKWIAYYKGSNVSGYSEQEGLHLLDINCFSDSSSCDQGQVGIKVSYPFTWSPDSQFIAGIGEDTTTGTNSIDIFSIVNRGLVLYKIYPIASAIDWISWSPSGEIIAVDTRENILLLSIDSGDVRAIEVLPFISWIRIPK